MRGFFQCRAVAAWEIGTGVGVAAAVLAVAIILVIVRRRKYHSRKTNTKARTVWTSAQLVCTELF